MLGLTLGLGFWQLQRLAWKEAVILDLARAEAGPPGKLSGNSSPYSKVAVQGSFLPGLARYGAELHVVGRIEVMGAHVIRPVAVANVGTVLADVGWAPLTYEPASEPALADFNGYVRPPESGSWYSPSADLAAHRFFSLNPAEIAGVLGLGNVLPFTVVALGAPSQIPIPATTMPQPSNNHLMYALTWFALAAGLTAVFSAFVWQNRRRDVRASGDL